MSEVPKTFYAKADRVKFYNSKRWRRLRDYVVERDHHECKFCLAKGIITTDRKPGVVLEVDHIMSIIDYPTLVLDETNLQTLCRLCHNKKHKKYKKMQMSHQIDDDEWFG